MPELPEVETVCRGLAQKIGGGTIAHIDLHRKDLRTPFPKSLLKATAKARIGNIRRRAKYVLMDLDNGYTVILHLGMSGRLLIRSKKEKQAPQKHDHMIIHFRDGTDVIFNDPRRFGLVDIEKTTALEKHKLFSHLGFEPLDNNFTAKNLGAKLKGRKTSVKVALMDQRIVVGVGNIYASEALFMAGILPSRAAGKVTEKELAKLVPAIKKVLEKAIKAGGSSLRDYVQTDGELGYFQHSFAVYGRDGEKCRKCGNIIRKSVMGGRSTFYCPHCQK